MVFEMSITMITMIIIIIIIIIIFFTCYLLLLDETDPSCICDVNLCSGLTEQKKKVKCLNTQMLQL